MSVHPIKAILTSPSWNKSLGTTQPVLRPIANIPVRSSHKSYLTSEHIARLWIQMTSIYGTLFLNKHGRQDSGVWLDTLSGLTPLALESGIARLKSLSAGTKFCEFPPNCLQFKALCWAFYEDLKLPKLCDAEREMEEHWTNPSKPWSHPAVRFAASRLPADFFEKGREPMTYQSLKEARDLFKNAYELTCDLVKQGHDINGVCEKAISPIKPPSRTIAQTHLTALKQHLRGV